jgi:hypothetical protein
LKQNLRWWAVAGFLLTVAIAVGIPLAAGEKATPSERLISWAVVAGGVLLAIMAASPGGTLKALLTDSRNRYSDAQLITLGWFLTLVSAYLACALWNVAVWVPSPTRPLPVFVEIPASVWALAGIVTTTLVGTAIVINYKGSRDRIFYRSSAADAEISDLISRDEVGLEDTSNLAAVQQLLFQLAALASYIVAVARLMIVTAPATLIESFPSIPEGFLALLGVATAGALTYRAIPFTGRALGRAGMLDPDVCQAIVYGETGTIEVTQDQLEGLAEARRFIAGVAYKRNGLGLAKPKYPTSDELKQPFIRNAWTRCKTAAQDAKDDEVGTCNHFVIWYSDDAGKTPSKKPKRIRDNWPYDNANKIKKSWGPYTVNELGQDNIYVIQYCGVP